MIKSLSSTFTAAFSLKFKSPAWKKEASTPSPLISKGVCRLLLTTLGALVHSDEFCPETPDLEQLLSDLLARYPLERWYERQLLTREQVHTWLEQALALLTSGLDDSGERLV